MTPRDRYILFLVGGVLAAGAITVALGTAIPVSGGVGGPGLALVMLGLLVAVVVVRVLSRRRR